MPYRTELEELEAKYAELDIKVGHVTAGIDHIQKAVSFLQGLYNTEELDAARKELEEILRVLNPEHQTAHARVNAEKILLEQAAAQRKEELLSRLNEARYRLSLVAMTGDYTQLLAQREAVLQAEHQLRVNGIKAPVWKGVDIRQ